MENYNQFPDIFNLILSTIQFKERVRQEYHQISVPKSFLKEICTIQINLGRQTGQSETAAKLIQHYAIGNKR